MTLILPGCETYAVTVQHYYKEDIHIQARSEDEAIERATKIYKGYKVISARKYDWRAEMRATAVANAKYCAEQIAKVTNETY